MKRLKIIVGLVAIFVTLPIWFYLLYKVLQAVNASELMWFLFWIYFPVAIFSSILAEIAKANE